MQGFHPPSKRRERQLFVGTAGAGKTSAWWDIALMLTDTGSDATMYVLDIDGTTEADLDDPELAALDNVEIVVAQDWDGIQVATKDLLKAAGPDDWVVADGAGNVWDWILRNWWIEQAWGSRVDQYFAKVRADQLASMDRDGKTHAGTEFGGSMSIDWNYLTRAYLAWEQTITLTSRCHRILTAPAQEIRKGQDRPDIDRSWDTVKAAPVGQKRMDHRVHTALFFRKLKDRYLLTSVKDRRPRRLAKGVELGREGVPVPGFAVAYLMEVAGWKM